MAKKKKKTKKKTRTVKRSKTNSKKYVKKRSNSKRNSNRKKSRKKSLDQSKKLKKTVIVLAVVMLVVSSLFVFKPIKNGTEKNLKIKLNGNETITIEYGNEYKDEGATAFYKDLDITDKIIVDTDIDLKKLGTYSYKYTINYKNSTKDVERKVIIEDTKKPTIKLNGNSTITIYVGSNYSDKGAKATDNYDGDITKKIVKSGTVNTKKQGTYTITYKVSDSSKNEASITRKVKVINKPAITKNTNTTKSTKTTNSSGNKALGQSSKGYKIERKNGLYYVGGILIVNKTYDLPSTYNPGGLLKVFTTNFNKMKEAAKKDGVSLRVISGFRSYSTQRTLYNNYVRADGRSNADRYSARPGHSEHQTGLAADINKISYTWHTTKDGKWLYNNCYKYGFIIRYTKNGESKTGYRFEPWHIRYVGVELATKLYNGGNWIPLEEYLGITSKY